MAGPGVGHSLGPYATDFPWRTWKTNKTPFFQKTKKHESSVPGRRLFPAEARARLGLARGRPRAMQPAQAPSGRGWAGPCHRNERGTPHPAPRLSHRLLLPTARGAVVWPHPWRCLQRRGKGPRARSKCQREGKTESAPRASHVPGSVPSAGHADCCPLSAGHGRGRRGAGTLSPSPTGRA